MVQKPKIVGSQRVDQMPFLKRYNPVPQKRKKRKKRKQHKEDCQNPVS
jgi:hypothetical protein